MCNESDRMTDDETGEKCIDCETGESPPKTLLNNETGEPELNTIRLCPTTDTYSGIVRKPFRIPAEYILANSDKPQSKFDKPQSKFDKLQSNSDSYPSHYDRIPQNSSSINRISPILLFLLPSLFFAFAPLLCVVVGGVIEVCLHMWAHKKNSQNRDDTVWYQSPLHIVASEFCYACIDEYGRERISKLQDQRKEINRIKRSIAYVRRVVT